MLYDSESGDILMAITGDALITRSHSQYREERFLETVQMLRDADLTYTNAESPFRYDDEDYPNGLNGVGTPGGHSCLPILV